MQALFPETPEEPIVNVRLSAADLELVEHALRALGYAPGYDYGQILDARTLADRLRASVLAEPVTTR